MHDIPAVCEKYEQQSKENIADIGEHMIEITQQAKWMCTQEVVVAQILISCSIQDLLTSLKFCIFMCIIKWPKK